MGGRVRPRARYGRAYKRAGPSEQSRLAVRRIVFRRVEGERRSLIAAAKTVDLDLDKPFRVDEPRDAHEGAGRSNMTKKLPMRTGGFPPTVNVGEHHARSNDILKATSCFLDCPAGDDKAGSGLLVDIAGMSRSAVWANRRCPGHGQIGSTADGSRESNCRLQGGGRRYKPPRHGALHVDATRGARLSRGPRKTPSSWRRSRRSRGGSCARTRRRTRSEARAGAASGSAASRH
jgi:hypothetical protein